MGICSRFDTSFIILGPPVVHEAIPKYACSQTVNVVKEESAVADYYY